MGKTVLVGPDIEEGHRLLALLKDEDVKVKAALWQKDEFGRWGLVIVTPLVETLGLRETFGRVRDVLKAHSLPIDLLNVWLFSPKSSLYKSLRRGLLHATNLVVSKQPIGDHYVEEGFIYFVK